MWEKNTGGGATPHPIICDKALALDIYEHLKKLEGCDNDLKKNGIYTYVLGAIIEASELFEYRRFENSDFALRVIEYLQKNYDKNLSLDEVSRELGYNRCYFSTLFNKNFRVGFRMYLNTMRINNSLSMLDSHSTSEIARRVGFESVQVYYSNFRRVMGCTPTQYMMQKSSSNN